MIPDANAIGDLNGPSEDGKPVLNWLERGNGALIIGGELTEELGKSAKLMTFLATLNRAGRKRLHRIDDKVVRLRTEKLLKAKVCDSNDPHVIALIQLSGCELIFSKDKTLHKDLQDREIVGHGVSIYQNKDHRHLLTDCNCVR